MSTQHCALKKEDDVMRTLKGVALAVMFLLPFAAGCMRPHGFHHGDMDTATERGIHEMEGLVDKTVKDPVKAERVKGYVKEIVQEAKLSIQQKREYHKKLYDLNANYNAPAEDFTKILDEQYNASMRSATKILGLRFKAKEELTADEWKALTDGMNKYRGRYWGDKSAS